MTHATITLTTTNVDGIHARPASAISRLVMASGCSVTIQYGEQMADGGSVLEILMLGIPCQAVLHIQITGARAVELGQELKTLFASDFAIP